jgi:hypothetical protein
LPDLRLEPTSTKGLLAAQVGDRERDLTTTTNSDWSLRCR